MIRVVLDTNILVSALLQPLGPPARVLLLARDKSIELCISAEIYAEYEEVLARPRLRLDDDVVSSALEFIRSNGVWIVPNVEVRECLDPDDDMFLECAVCAGADVLITGNRRDFPAFWPLVSIVTPREFLDGQAG